MPLSCSNFVTLRHSEIMMLPMFATLLLLFWGLLSAQGQKPTPHFFFHVTLSPEVKAPQSGRLLIFLHPGTGKDHLDAGNIPGETWIAAREIDSLAPGEF